MTEGQVEKLVSVANRGIAGGIHPVIALAALETHLVNLVRKAKDDLRPGMGRAVEILRAQAARHKSAGRQACADALLGVVGSILGEIDRMTATSGAKEG